MDRNENKTQENYLTKRKSTQKPKDDPAHPKQVLETLTIPSPSKTRTRRRWDTRGKRHISDILSCLIGHIGCSLPNTSAGNQISGMVLKSSNLTIIALNPPLPARIC